MDLANLAKNPVPSGAISGLFRSFDQAPMRYALWQASKKPRRGTVCLFNGRTEFIEKYYEVIADLRRRGFAVATMDWRGQGGSHRALSNPNKGHIDSFKTYDQDLMRFMKDIVLPDCPPPYIGMAHSMGGAILLRAARQTDSWFERMVLSAPMVRLDYESLGTTEKKARWGGRTASLVGAGSRYVPGGADIMVEWLTFEGNPLTSDRERFERANAIVNAVPELNVGSPTLGWLHAAMQSMDEIRSPRFRLDARVPMLFIAAGEDTVVSSRAIEDLSASLKLGTHVIIPHARHEILQERDILRQQFWAAFDAYTGVSESV